MTLKTFSPAGGGVGSTVSIAGTIASASATLDAYSAAVRVFNAGPNVAFLRFTTGASTATGSDMPIAAGATETFTKGSATNVSAICASGTAALYFTNGEGL